MAKRASMKGRGADIFFGDDTPLEEAPVERAAQPPAVPLEEPRDLAPPASIHALRDTSAEEPLARTQERKTASVRASMLANTDGVIASIRRTVKDPGREVLYVRLTAEEKAELDEIVYGYKRKGRKTTDTLIGRIAVNTIIEDYKRNGDTSVLARVLAALLA